MILTCPSCGTQYVVKDGAIPPHGRQVRCASCKHSWHQDAEPPAFVEDGEESLAEALQIDPSSGPEAEERAYEEAALAAEIAGEAGEAGEAPAGYAPISPPDFGDEFAATEEPEGTIRESETIPVESELDAIAREAQANGGEPTPAVEQPTEDDEFSPFVLREPDEPESRGPLFKILLAALLIAAVAAAFWFLAPASWKERVGIADAGETPLQLMMTHSDRQKLASGNELLAVSGRVINPTDENQNVPPIQAQLRNQKGKLVYSWTIAPPARILPPGASATFNSAEVNVPAGGDELTITLGDAKT
ncbi:zinc-ribbon domain-containing protein [Sphingomonas sp.]|uniref:zinc-ribbon domain-containing protein n=1 Tax=Sphingomonas sp. TaxID=28214 RepID=UPI00286D5C50|nr:zinc-ribbon domain-containing protein [Sphingomonas sp.]